MRPFFVHGAWKAIKCLELVHTDLVGPMQTESLGGNKYFMFLTNDFGCMSWLFFIKIKSQALECFKKFKIMAEIQSGCTLKAHRSDRGGEFTSKEFTEFCEVHALEWSTIHPTHLSRMGW